MTRDTRELLFWTFMTVTGYGLMLELVLAYVAWQEGC